VRVHLTTRISGEHVDLGLVHKPNDLNIIRGLGELHARDGPIRDNTCPMARFRTPRHHLTLDAADVLAWAGRSPEAEIIKGVDECGLAERSGTFGCGVALIVADLLASG